MTRNGLNRLISLLLMPCLLAEPAGASLFAFRPENSPFAGRASLADQTRLNREALAPMLAWVMHPGRFFHGWLGGTNVRREAVGEPEAAIETNVVSESIE